MSASGISFGGLSSGIDTEGIITKLIALEGFATTRLQRQQRVLNQREAVYGQFISRVSAVSQAGGRLNISTAFNPVSAKSSDETIAKISATAGAASGSYKLNVTKLAQAQKTASAAQTDTSTALGRAGTIVVGGKALKIESADSLRSIADKVNGLGVGVTAGLIDGGAGAAYLTFSSAATGSANRLKLADVSGSVLQGLGVLGGTVPPPGTGTSYTSSAFADSTTAVGTLLGATGLAPTSFTVGGRSVDVDLSTDSLQAVADKINAAAALDQPPAASATVKAVTTAGGTRYQLEITGSPRPTLADPNGTLETLGVIERAGANELVAAQDAAYTLDGISLTSDKNEVTGAVPGATIGLLKTGESTLTLAKDAAGVKSNVNEFLTAVNGALGYVKEASAFDKETYESGPLFGDPAARQFVSSLSTSLFQSTGLPDAKYRNLASIGFSMSKEGLLALDETQFDKALTERPDEIRQLFQTAGSSATSGLSFVSATAKTTASQASGFAVDITALATKSTFLAGTAQTDPNATSEILTFAGGPFGSEVKLTIDGGSTLAATVAKINADPRLKEGVVATIDAGRLKLESRKFGTGGRFGVTSNQSGAAGNSGVGTAGSGTSVAGLDVAGTIAGEAATGFGQFLTGAATNTKAQGLQIQYNGTATGSIGTMVFSRGLSSLVSETVSGFNDLTNGLVTQAQKAMQDQSSQIDATIERNGVALKRRETELRRKFAAMETAISRIQAQGSQLASLSNIK